MSNIIVMTFSPRNIVGCLLKKSLQRGAHGHPRTPPRYALGYMQDCDLYILHVDTDDVIYNYVN